jgi:hypothetical protein
MAPHVYENRQLTVWTTTVIVVLLATALAPQPTTALRPGMGRHLRGLQGPGLREHARSSGGVFRALTQLQAAPADQALRPVTPPRPVQLARPAIDSVVSGQLVARVHVPCMQPCWVHAAQFARCCNAWILLLLLHRMRNSVPLAPLACPIAGRHQDCRPVSSRGLCARHAQPQAQQATAAGGDCW